MKIRVLNTLKKYEIMQEDKKRYILSLLDEELHRLIAYICEVPYSALPLERPEIICFDRRVEELTGYTANEILTNTQLWINMVYPVDREQVFAAFAQCKNQGIPFEIEYRITHKSGLLHYVIDKGEPVFNGRGEIIRIDGIITDISEFEKARICVCQKNPKVTKSKNVNSSVFQKV